MRSSGSGSSQRVAVGEHAFVDRGDHLGRQLRHRGVALAEGEHPVQVHEPEVAGVLPVVDLGEHGAERLDGDGLDRPHEVGVAMGPTEVGVDAGRVRRVVDAGGELEVLVDAGLPDGLVDQPGRSWRDDRCGRRAERDGRGGGVRGDGRGAVSRRSVGRAGRLRGRRARGVVVARAAGHDRCGCASTGDQEPPPVEKLSIATSGEVTGVHPGDRRERVTPCRVRPGTSSTFGARCHMVGDVLLRATTGGCCTGV